jgi:spermidine synthase
VLESPRMADRPPDDDRVLGLGLLAVSFVVLSYEVTQLRVFAYSLDPVLVLTGVSITMLGFGLASTVLSLSARLARLPLRPLLAATCLALALTGLLANLVFAVASPGIGLSPNLAGTLTLTTVAVILLCTLPYACGGFVVALVLSRRSAASGRLYFINLVGSGLGCFVISFGLRPLGAERLLLLLLALAALTGAWLAAGEARRLRAGCLVVGLLLAAAVPLGPRLLRFQPDAGDQHAAMAAAYRKVAGVEPVREFGQWDPVARVEVHSWPGQQAFAPAPIPFKMLTQDGGAASVLLGVDADPEKGRRLFGASLYTAALQLRPGARVLVVGAGGGPDVQAALHHHAKSITAVEINAATVDVVKSRFADFLGRPYQQPGVQVVLADGRSFVRRTREHYDIIQMSGVDTLTLQSSGSFVLAEEYLYTVDAFEDYLRALQDDGILSIIRFGREPVRLAALAAAALRRRGVAHPEQHVVIVAQSLANLVLVKPTPFTREEVQKIDFAISVSAAANHGITVPAYDVLGIHLGAPLGRAYAPYVPPVEPVVHEYLRQTLASASAPVATPTDDRPYYFIAEWMGYFKGEKSGPMSSVVGLYVRFVAVLCGVAFLLILLPPALRRWPEARPARATATLAYFFALGFCYMFLEIGLIQKAVIVVEHPAYSVAVVLASLLVSSAVGSLLSARLRIGPRALAVGTGVVIAVVGGAYALALGPIFRAMMALPFGLRLALVGLLVVPLGLPMGVLFPLGLRRLGAGAERLVPWAIATNSFASVLGSVLSVPFAVVWGFTALFGFGAAAYLLGSLAFLGLPASRDS